MPNAWIITHLKAYRAKHKGMSLSTAMKQAKKTYKKKSGATKVTKVKATKKSSSTKKTTRRSKAKAPVEEMANDVKPKSRRRKK